MIPEEQIEKALERALREGLDRDAIETVVREWLDYAETLNDQGDE